MQARARDVRPLQQPKLRLAAQLLVLFLVPAIWLLVSTDYITSIASAPRQSSRDLDFVAKPGEALAAIAGVKRIRSFRLHQHPEIPYLLVASPYEPALLFSFDASGHLERVLDIPVKACRDVVGFTLGDSSWILPISGAAATSPLYRVIALSSRDGEGVEGDTAASIRVQHVADVETQGASSVSAFVRGGRQPEAVVVMTHPRSGQLSAHRMTAADPGGLTRPFQRIDLPGVASLGCCEAAAAALSKGSLQADGGSGGDSLQYLVAAPHQAVDGYEHAAHLLQYDGVQLTSIQQFSVQAGSPPVLRLLGQHWMAAGAACDVLLHRMAAQTTPPRTAGSERQDACQHQQGAPQCAVAQPFSNRGLGLELACKRARRRALQCAVALQPKPIRSAACSLPGSLPAHLPLCLFANLDSAS